MYLHYVVLCPRLRSIIRLRIPHQHRFRGPKLGFWRSTLSAGRVWKHEAAESFSASNAETLAMAAEDRESRRGALQDAQIDRQIVHLTRKPRVKRRGIRRYGVLRSCSHVEAYCGGHAQYADCREPLSAHGPDRRVPQPHAKYQYLRQRNQIAIAIAIAFISSASLLLCVCLRDLQLAAPPRLSQKSHAR